MCDRRQGQKVSLTRDAKITGSIFGRTLGRDVMQSAKMLKRDSKLSRSRTTTENNKDHINLCVYLSRSSEIGFSVDQKLLSQFSYTFTLSSTTTNEW